MSFFLATNNWYDFRDLSNLSRVILEGAGNILPHGIVYILAPLIGFVASFLIFVLPSQLYVGVLGERKIIGRIQSRYGPNRVGMFGVLQPIADAIKLLSKEALTPKGADKAVMWLAPVIFVMPAVMLFAVIPFGPRMIIADIPNSLLYFLALSSIPVLATFMSGWSHNNKYSLFGAIRIVAMTVSFEVPLVLALLGVGAVHANGKPAGYRRVPANDAHLADRPAAAGVRPLLHLRQRGTEPHADGHRRSRIRDRRGLPH